MSSSQIVENNKTEQTKNELKEQYIKTLEKTKENFKSWFGREFNLRLLVIKNAYSEVVDRECGHKTIEICQAVIECEDFTDPTIEFAFKIPVSGHPRSRFGLLMKSILDRPLYTYKIQRLVSLLPEFVGKILIGDVLNFSYNEWDEGKRRKRYDSKIYETFPYIPYHKYVANDNKIVQRERWTRKAFEIYAGYPNSNYEIKARK